MNLADLERIVRQGAAALADGVLLYAPSPASTGASLAQNLTLHVGRRLLDAGFLAHAEVHGEGRTDLLAVHPPTGSLVIAEVRRLDGHGGTVLYDRARLATFTPPDGARRHPGLTLGARYGILAGTSTNREYARWFTAMDASSIAPTPELAALKEELPQGTIWNGWALSDLVDAGGQRRTEWLLYAIFQLR